MNWRGKPLIDLATIVSLIGTARTASGLRVRAEIDRRPYPSGVIITADRMAKIRLKPHRFNGDWRALR